MLSSSFPEVFYGKPIPKALLPNANIFPVSSSPAIKIRRNGITTKYVIDGELIDLPLPKRQAI